MALQRSATRATNAELRYDLDALSVTVDALGVSDYQTFSIGDIGSAITTGSKLKFRAYGDRNLIDVRASLAVAQASGSTFTVEIRVNGVSVLGSQLTIDNGEKTSFTASIPVSVIAPSMINDAEIEVYVSSIGDGTAKGLSVTFSWGPYYAVPDPYAASVIALLHFDGTNGSTSITDETLRSWTAYNNAQISTSDSEFGGASLRLDGTDDYVQTADDADFAFGSADWTVECWINEVNQGATHQIIGQHSVSGGATASSFILYSDSGTLYLSVYVGGTTYTVTGLSTHAANSRLHAAAVRYGGDLMLFLDGAEHGTTAISGALNDSPEPVTIGAVMLNSSTPYGSGLAFDGYVDELRITKGLARYTSAFTPPSSPFSV